MNKERKTYPVLKEVINIFTGENLIDNSGRGFRFPVYLTEKSRQTPIEVLDLSVRSTHALKRAGITTMADVYEKISRSSDLKQIRSCGSKSIEEIMERIFLYQLCSHQPEKQADYIKKVIELNI